MFFSWQLKGLFEVVRGETIGWQRKHAAKLVLGKQLNRRLEAQYRAYTWFYSNLTALAYHGLRAITGDFTERQPLK
jgi:hypothetical protein